jgi:hypothetical protein
VGHTVQGSPFNALVLLAIAVAVVAAGVHARGAEAARVDVRITMASDLPDAARRTLVEEVDAIWREAGVGIRWVEGHEPDGSTRALRVLVVQRPVGSRHGGDWVVGELLRFDGGAAIAVVSIARAEQIVHAAAAGTTRVTPHAVVQRRLGVVLGRAVAHEIGHYLLGDGVHARHGLMRRTFQPREFADLRPRTFALDEHSQRLIHERLVGPDRADGALALSSPSF